MSSDYENEVTTWRQRRFVKPGLIGVAQINGAFSKDPAKKLRYDIEYIRWQSLRFDAAIAIRQVWTVLTEPLPGEW